MSMTPAALPAKSNAFALPASSAAAQLRQAGPVFSGQSTLAQPVVDRFAPAAEQETSPTFSGVFTRERRDFWWRNHAGKLLIASLAGVTLWGGTSAVTKKCEPDSNEAACLAGEMFQNGRDLVGETLKLGGNVGKVISTRDDHDNK